MARIVGIALDFEDTDFERDMVEAAGIEFAAYPARDAASVARHVAGADGAITSYGEFDASVFGAASGLRVLSRTGTGVDNIDLDAATAAGCAVCNVPGYGTEVVSDHAIALALACLRRINELDAALRARTWDFQQARPLGQVRGRVFGVVGMGAIGRAVARKAAGLGFEVACWDRKLAPGTVTDEGYRAMGLDDLLASVDVASFHTALVPETHHLLDEGRIASLRPDAVVVNTSRGAIVDTDALARALDEGRLWGAGLDVFEDEPLDFDSPIARAPRTVLTPHAAYWSEESAVELRTRATQAAIDVVLGREPADCLNPQVLPRALKGAGA